MSLPSGALVAAQFVLLATLAVTTQVQGLGRGWLLGLPLFALGTVLGMWALGHNQVGNFNIRPEVRADAELVTGGPYRYIRHPMYTALLAACGGLVAIDPRPLRLLILAALALVLNAKALREEALLARRFPGYAAYAARNARFLPGVY
jgi:protein-S-isoprenylcysteine O-methyltransferase Ste14